MALTPFAERSGVELSLPVFMIYVCRGWDSNTQPSAGGANAQNHSAGTALAIVSYLTHLIFKHLIRYALKTVYQYIICLQTNKNVH